MPSNHSDLKRAAGDVVRASAKTGDGVEEAFRRLGRSTLARREASR